MLDEALGHFPCCLRTVQMTAVAAPDLKLNQLKLNFNSTQQLILNSEPDFSFRSIIYLEDYAMHNARAFTFNCYISHSRVLHRAR